MNIEFHHVGTISLSALIVISTAINFVKNKKEKNKKIIEQEKKRQDYYTKMKGVQETQKKIDHLDVKTYKDQFRSVKDISDMMYSCIEDIYIEKLAKNNILTIMTIKNTLSIFRQETDEMMTKIIYQNGIAEKSEKDWSHYKEMKIRLIYKKIESLGKMLFDTKCYNNLTYNEVEKIVYNETKEIYLNNIVILFNDIRSIAQKNKEEIKSLKQTIKEMYRE